MRNWTLPTYKPKVTEVEFNVKNIPRQITQGIVIKADNEDYNKKSIAHAYIHLNGEIKLCLDDKMISENDNYLVIKVLVVNRRDNKTEGLKQIISGSDYLKAPQLDAIAWLCRKWCVEYYTDNIINEAGIMFPMDLLTKYVRNEGFTKYQE